MTRSRALLPALVLVGLLGGALLTVTPVAAHASGSILVPELPAGRPQPRVDASCESDYRASSNARTIQYRPGYNWPPATIRMITSNGFLFVCIQGLSRRPNGSSTTPYVALVFDPDHNGGAAPDSDDLNLSLDELGHPREWHGNGTGFVPQSFASNWNAVTDTSSEITWDAEFQIRLSKIHARPGAIVGFQVRHTSLLRSNDAFSWPTGSQAGQPETWGDLFFLGPTATVAGTVLLDAGRVTQGLEWDVAQYANKAYDFVAGKDAFMTARLYSRGSITNLTYSACQVQQLSPVLGPVQLIPVAGGPPGRIWPYPAGLLAAGGTFDCWLAGAIIAKPGLYQFSMRVRMESGDFQTVPVATRSIQPDRPVRVLIYRWIFPAGNAENRAWDAELNASAVSAMHVLQRVLPVPAGVGGLSLMGTPPPGSPGLRYQFSPTVYQCAIEGEETMDQASTRCDATVRNNGDLIRQEINDQAAHADAADGGHRDRIDLQEVFVSTPHSGGGQSCWANSRSAGSGLDSLTNGQSYFVPVQETQHCWGQVARSSPHSDPTNRPHSANYFFPPANGLPMINVETREAIDTPRGMMSPYFSDGEQSNTFINEGTEFNALREALLALPSTALLPPSGAHLVGSGPVPADKGGPPPPPPAAIGAPVKVQVAFLVDQAGHVTLQVSRALPNSVEPETMPDPSSPYALVFRDGTGNPLATVPFAVTTQGTHNGSIPITGEVLLATAPAGTATVEIDKASSPLFSEAVTAAAPAVSNVAVQSLSPASLKVTWDAADADGPALRYSVYLQRHPGELRSLIATGLTDTQFVFDTSFAPGTSDGVITVQASDGINTGEGSASPVSIGDKPPIVAISAPMANATVVAGQPIALSGTGYDMTAMDVVPGDSLTWMSDLAGPLGTGEALTTMLKPGTHVLTLTATVGKLTASAMVKVIVLADVDQDGLPDVYEAKHACLSSKKADGLGDPDADGVTSLQEYARGTDPCQADTDLDGWVDGDEVVLGSNPLSPKSFPVKDGIFLSSASVDLGSCASPKKVTVTVQTASKSTIWSTSTDVPFVVVSPGRSGPGTIIIAAACDGLPKGVTLIGHVGLEAKGGQFKLLTVRLRG